MSAPCGGMKFYKCSTRLNQLNQASKPNPVKVKGAQVSLENRIRRRVAPIKKSYQITNPDGTKGKWVKQEYGPLFGGNKQLIDGSCDGSSQAKGRSGYASNLGTNEDVVFFKRVYGGVRRLGNCDPSGNCACKPASFVNGKLTACQ